jgi:hypothetical protein
MGEPERLSTVCVGLSVWIKLCMYLYPQICGRGIPQICGYPYRKNAVGVWPGTTKAPTAFLR